ncbi:LysR family transcriptional regulator [Aquihabitans sp. G128]|uniref:LysR family transcriptional regulator n=1 Tax=Aquihabitans sp. G128 TaxID=2849779 RepID=UPI001C220192|nr:LysR substrate-binding domain-containing protein [Aquihabitans sp. G128]QXC62953.1 LysR family transcriptional regulator [Aquihabitans sp. G128]
MELRQLEYLVAVAEEGGFTRAAERVHISQSGVSAQIRQLERELGADLFDRTSRSVALTGAGRAALEHARTVLASAQAVRQAVDDVGQVVRGRLVVGMVTGCTITPLFDALAAFHDDHPGVELALVEDTSDRLVDQVRSGALDLALVGVAGAAPSGLDGLTTISEPVVAAVPRDHALARRKRTTLAAVAAHPVVALPPGTGIRAAFDQACTAAGVSPTVALEASAPDAVADLAARGLGVAVLSASMVPADHPDLVAVPITDARVPALLALTWKPTPGPALAALLRHTHRTFGR